MIRRFNICTKKVFSDKNGVEQKQWLRVGNLIQFPANGDKVEGYKLELYMFPDTPFAIFEDRPKENGEAVIDADTRQTTPPKSNKTLPAKPTKVVTPSGIEYPQEINPDDIPF